jgi:hypothetical protein
MLQTISRTAPGPGIAARPARPARNRARLFTAALLFLCLFLQRFGTPVGGGMVLNIVGPLGLGLAMLAALAGVLAFDRARLTIFSLLLGLVLIGQAHAQLGKVAYNGVISMPSMYQWLGVTSFAVFVFAEPMPEKEFFGLVNRFLLVIAFAGIIQFFAQLVGVQIFRFTGILPDSLLAEANWNLRIGSGIDDLYKSNGLFLVEPSVTSQFMAIGIIIEILYFRRLLYLGVLGLALVVAFSGTGGLVLGAFVLTVALRLGWKGLVLAALVVLFAAVFAVSVVLIVPAAGEIATTRLNEFTTIGTSGFLRFVTPFWLLGDVLREYPLAGLLGIGAGTSERLTMPYHYSVDTPVKIAVEYGFPVLILYLTLFLVARRTRRQSVLVPPAFVLLMFAGGYQQFAPVIYPMMLLICTAWLTEAAPASGASRRAASR